MAVDYHDYHSVVKNLVMIIIRMEGFLYFRDKC